jgi:glycosyltransferase involved in cell wall biosynthesis
MTTPRSPAPDVSIVVPIYNEVDNLPDLVARIGAAMAGQPLGFELLAVDDGSTDGSRARLRELAASTPWLRPVLLARNYGQSSALQAGFDRVRGRYVVTLDADLQNEPGDIPLLLQRLEADPDVDMVSGWRKDRQDAELSRKLPSRIANKLISSATGVHLHDYGCALKAYRRPIIDRIRLYGELHRFIPSLAKEAGARIAEVPVRHHARTRGVSKYGIDRTFRVILDLILIVFFMRYRQRPLHAFGGLGLWLTAPGVLILLWLLLAKAAGRGHRRPAAAAGGRDAAADGRAADRRRPDRRAADPHLPRGRRRAAVPRRPRYVLRDEEANRPTTPAPSAPVAT